MSRLATVLRPLAITSGAALLLAACATYRSQLHRGQRYYEENQYEAALALWRDLEADADSLTPSERVRYAYFRGMTGYRLGYRADARYWLSLAQAGEQLHPTSLGEERRQRLEATLSELHKDVLPRGSASEPPSALPPPRGALPGDALPGFGAAGGQPGPNAWEAPGSRDDAGAGEAEADEGSDPAARACAWSTECPAGHICLNRVCVEL